MTLFVSAGLRGYVYISYIKILYNIYTYIEQIHEIKKKRI